MSQASRTADHQAGLARRRRNEGVDARQFLFLDIDGGLVQCPRQSTGSPTNRMKPYTEYTHAALDISPISHIYRRGTREKFMKPIADDVIVNACYIDFDYFLSCIPINGKILKLEGSFVTREVYSLLAIWCGWGTRRWGGPA
jgi:hypothetical protein